MSTLYSDGFIRLHHNPYVGLCRFMSGKLSTLYSHGFICLHNIPPVGLCRFMPAVNCEPCILVVS